jgi:hypothetical protein
MLDIHAIPIRDIPAPPCTTRRKQAGMTSETIVGIVSGKGVTDAVGHMGVWGIGNL